MQTAAAIIAAHAAPLPASADLDSVKAALAALPPGFSPAALASNEVYFTYEAGGLPLVTLQRPRMIGGDGLYTLALIDGREVAFFDRCPTVRRVYEAVYSYLRAGLPADCDAAEELESYLASFDANMTLAAESAYPVFKASALTRCARWARRVALARAAIVARMEALCDLSGTAEEEAPEAPEAPFFDLPGDDGRKSLDDLEAEDRAAKAAERAARKSLDDLEEEARAASLGVALAGAAIGAARRMTEAPAGLALAPVTPALESPLVPFAPGASRVALAIARGYDPARLIAGDFGPRARYFVGGF